MRPSPRSINLAVKTALDLPAVREKMVSLGNVPRYETIEQFRATVKADRAKWAEVVEGVGRFDRLKAAA